MVQRKQKCTLMMIIALMTLTAILLLDSSCICVDRVGRFSVSGVLIDAETNAPVQDVEIDGVFLNDGVPVDGSIRTNDVTDGGEFEILIIQGRSGTCSILGIADAISNQPVVVVPDALELAIIRQSCEFRITIELNDFNVDRSNRGGRVILKEPVAVPSCSDGE